MAMPLPPAQVQAILEEAKRWRGTPYQHQASLCRHGADCLGLVRGIWRHLYGAEPEDLPAYSPNWAEEKGEETLYHAARRHLTEITAVEAMVADVLLFRMAPSSPAKHAAILMAPNRIIHAYWGRAVTESVLRPFWAARLAYAFRFPPMEKYL